MSTTTTQHVNTQAEFLPGQNPNNNSKEPTGSETPHEQLENLPEDGHSRDGVLQPSVSEGSDGTGTTQKGGGRRKVSYPVTPPVTPLQPTKPKTMRTSVIATQLTNKTDTSTMPTIDSASIKHNNRITEIKELHDQILFHAQTTVEKAVQIGELLTAIKSTLPHGDWLPFLERNFPFTERTASRYMKLFNNRKLIRKSDTMSVLNLNAVYAQLKTTRGSRKSAEQDTTPINSTELKTTPKLITLALPPDENGKSYFELKDALESGDVVLHADAGDPLPIDVAFTVTPVPGDTGTSGAPDGGKSIPTDGILPTEDKQEPASGSGQKDATEGKGELTAVVEVAAIYEFPANAVAVELALPMNAVKATNTPDPVKESPQAAPVAKAEPCVDDIPPFRLADGSELPSASLAVGLIDYEEMLSTTERVQGLYKPKSQTEKDACTLLQQLQIGIASLLNQALGGNPTYTGLHKAEEALTCLRNKVTTHSAYHRKPASA